MWHKHVVINVNILMHLQFTCTVHGRRNGFGIGGEPVLSISMRALIILSVHVNARYNSSKEIERIHRVYA